MTLQHRLCKERLGKPLRQRHLAQGEDGMTLVEVIVALVVLLIVLVPAMDLMAGAANTTAEAGFRVTAGSIAMRTIELAKGEPLGSLDIGQLPSSFTGGFSTWPPPTTTWQPWWFQWEKPWFSSLKAGNITYDIAQGAAWVPLPTSSPPAPGVSLPYPPDAVVQIGITVAWPSHGRLVDLQQSSILGVPPGYFQSADSYIVVQAPVAVTSVCASAVLHFGSNTYHWQEPAVRVDAQGYAYFVNLYPADYSVGPCGGAAGTQPTPPTPVAPPAIQGGHGYYVDLPG
ncbi:MAG: prepilin-type N-terminal cleavage/methylation domain-containing protein [Acidimicrobiales bacterium]